MGAPLKNGIEDMEVHGAIEGILRAAAGERPGADQNSELGDAEGVTATTSSRKRSAVWMHYQKVDDERKALCLLCKEKIQHQSSTSNLLLHLQKKHPSHFSKLETRPLKRTGGRRTCCMKTPQASTDLMVNVHTDKHQSNDTGTPSSAVSSPNHQLNTEQLVQSPNHSSDSCSGLFGSVSCCTLHLHRQKWKVWISISQGEIDIENFVCVDAILSVT